MGKGFKFIKTFPIFICMSLSNPSHSIENPYTNIFFPSDPSNYLWRGLDTTSLIEKNPIRSKWMDMEIYGFNPIWVKKSNDKIRYIEPKTGLKINYLNNFNWLLQSEINYINRKSNFGNSSYWIKSWDPEINLSQLIGYNFFQRTLLGIKISGDKKQPDFLKDFELFWESRLIKVFKFQFKTGKRFVKEPLIVSQTDFGTTKIKYQNSSHFFKLNPQIIFKSFIFNYHLSISNNSYPKKIENEITLSDSGSTIQQIFRADVEVYNILGGAELGLLEGLVQIKGFNENTSLTSQISFQNTSHLGGYIKGYVNTSFSPFKLNLEIIFSEWQLKLLEPNHPSSQYLLSPVDFFGTAISGINNLFLKEVWLLAGQFDASQYYLKINPVVNLGGLSIYGQLDYSYLNLKGVYRWTNRKTYLLLATQKDVIQSEFLNSQYHLFYPGITFSWDWEKIRVSLSGKQLIPIKHVNRGDKDSPSTGGVNNYTGGNEIKFSLSYYY